MKRSRCNTVGGERLIRCIRLFYAVRIRLVLQKLLREHFVSECQVLGGCMHRLTLELNGALACKDWRALLDFKVWVGEDMMI